MDSESEKEEEKKKKKKKKKNKEREGGKFKCTLLCGDCPEEILDALDMSQEDILKTHRFLREPETGKIGKLKKEFRGREQEFSLKNRTKAQVQSIDLYFGHLKIYQNYYRDAANNAPLANSQCGPTVRDQIRRDSTDFFWLSVLVHHPELIVNKIFQQVPMMLQVAKRSRVGVRTKEKLSEESEEEEEKVSVKEEPVEVKQEPAEYNSNEDEEPDERNFDDPAFSPQHSVETHTPEGYQRRGKRPQEQQSSEQQSKRPKTGSNNAELDEQERVFNAKATQGDRKGRRRRSNAGRDPEENQRRNNLAHAIFASGLTASRIRKRKAKAKLAESSHNDEMDVGLARAGSESDTDGRGQVEHVAGDGDLATEAPLGNEIAAREELEYSPERALDSTVELSKRFAFTLERAQRKVIQMAVTREQEWSTKIKNVQRIERHNVRVATQEVKDVKEECERKLQETGRQFENRLKEVEIRYNASIQEEKNKLQKVKQDNEKRHQEDQRDFAKNIEEVTTQSQSREREIKVEWTKKWDEIEKDLESMCNTSADLGFQQVG